MSYMPKFKFVSESFTNPEDLQIRYTEIDEEGMFAVLKAGDMHYCSEALTKIGVALIQHAAMLDAYKD